MKSKFLMSALAVLALTACNSSNDGSNVVLPKTQAGKDLQGNWESPCVTESGFKAIRNLAFSGDTMAVGKALRQLCDDEGYAKSTATFTITGGEDATSLSGSKNINATLTSYTIIPSGDDAAVFLNGSSECGFTDWEAEKSKDILGKTCTNFAPTLTAGDELFQVYKITNNTLQIGDIGAGDDGSSEQERPTALEATIFTKK